MAMKKETKQNSNKNSEIILNKLRKKYPGKAAFDLDGRINIDETSRAGIAFLFRQTFGKTSSEHFVCEVEPTKDHPEYDRAIEVIITSRPHKHLKTTQFYTILSGSLKLHLDKKVITLHPGDLYTIRPGIIHWATSDECWMEIHSTPGWTKEDHILID